MDIRPSFHVLIATGGRPSLLRMLDSLRGELEECDAITIVFDGDAALGKSEFSESWLQGHKSKVNIIEQIPNLGYWGHGIRNKYQGILNPSTTFVLNADDDDMYLPGSFAVLRRECKDPDVLYIARVGFDNKSNQMPSQNLKIKEADIGTPCGIIPSGIADKAIWQHRYGGDFDYFNVLQGFAKSVSYVDLLLYKVITQPYSIRLHILGLPYTITRDEYSHDAYTGKVQRFSPMMRSRGFEVYHYGVETSKSGATKNFDLMTIDEWNALRIESLQYLDPKISLEDAKKKLESSYVIPALMNWSTPLSKEFNRRLKIKLAENYRGKTSDIVCLPLGKIHDEAIKGLNCVPVESGIGYTGSYLDFRVFETYAWMSKALGMEKKQPSNYWFVVPNYFDTKEFQLTLRPTPKRIGFLGRICSVKGCGIMVEIAKRFPDIEFILCGSGDPTEFLKVPNIIYKKPIHGAERSDYLGGCVAVLCLSKFLEPFCGVAVESQLCGTPVICSDWGGMAETVEQFKTGFRGRTIADYCYGVQLALDGKFDREYIRNRAVKLFDMYTLAYNYEYLFKSIIEIYSPGKNGWYSSDTYIRPLIKHAIELPASSYIERSKKISEKKIRLHIPAIPYTITRSEYSHDAFTNKVRLFSPMMRSRGFEVYHYGVETSESGATKNFDLMTKEEWTQLRIDTIRYLDPKLSLEDAIKKNNDPGMFVSELSNWTSPLTKEFNKRFRAKLVENYRGVTTDIVCIPLSKTYQEALDKLGYVVIEHGIGYEGSSLGYRIFEAYSWMSRSLGIEDKQPQNYWFVIPHAFDTKEFQLSLAPFTKRVGFLGRITNLKGCGIIREIAKRFPDVEFVLCGQGDYKPYTDIPNVLYKPPIHGSERSEFLGSCVAFLHLAKYLEPFGCGPVEAQLCGTPVICSDWGGMVETVEQGKTGLRGHTVADYCYGVQMALDGKFDREYIRKRAANMYDMYKLACDYDYVFRTILDVHTPGKGGWYSPDTHIVPFLEEKDNQRIYLFIPYYGTLPNYFQLYLDSLGINTDILTVFLITDIDVSSYSLPENLIVIKMPKLDVQQRASKLILDVYGKTVAPEDLLQTNYKLVDFKISYPVLFDDIIKKYAIKTNDYVGWGDVDLIYGKLSNFIDFKMGYGIIGGWHGHFTAIQNTESFKYNFKTIPNYLELITDNSTTFVTDEIAYRKPLIQYIRENKIKMFYTNNFFCDIVPECYYAQRRPEYKSRDKNFFHVYNTIKNISHLYYDKIQSSLRMVYDDGETVDTLYCHLQKRPMKLPFTSYTGYYIYEDTFRLSPDVDMVYYINLDKRTDRNEHMLKQFETANIPLDKVKRVSAINGDTYSFSDEELALFSKADFMHTPSAKKMMGNQLSHFSIFKDMLKNNYEKVLILQDDAVLRGNFIEHLNNVSNALPSDCEIVNLGMHEYCYFNVFRAYDLTADDDFIRVEKEKINEYISVWKNNIQPCSLSYIITKRGSKNMISHFEKNGFPCGTDIAFNRYLQGKNIFYGSRTVLCTGDPSFGTDIFNTEAWWKKP